MIALRFIDHVHSDHAFEDRYLFYQWLLAKRDYSGQQQAPAVELPLAGDADAASGMAVAAGEGGGAVAAPSATEACLAARVQSLERRVAMQTRAAPLFALAGLVVAGTEWGWWACAAALAMLAVAALRTPPAPAPPALPPPVPRRAAARKEEAAAEKEEEAVAAPPLDQWPQCECSGQPVRLNAEFPIRGPNFEGTGFAIVRGLEMPERSARYFAGKKRQVEVHVQGRFLRRPEGPLFYGGELTELPVMKFGLVMRGLLYTLLSAVRALSPSDVHSSFGDGNQRPHLATSFFNMVDYLVVTPEGEAPPPIGEAVLEDGRARKARRKASKHPPIDTTSTYTFTFHTAYVNVISWRVENLRGVRGMQLSRFWSSSPLAFVLYEAGDAGSPGEGHSPTARHPYFCLTLRPDPECVN